jgi:hypothetical protein
VKSSEEEQQGDPFGPLIFCLSCNNYFIGLIRKASWDFQSWYLDDGVLIGSADELLRALNFISGFGCSLVLNLKKSDLFPLFVDLDHSRFPPDILRIESLDLL